MALPDLDVSVGHSFGLEVDGILIGRISEVSGLKTEQDVIEMKQNTPDGKYVVRRLPGRPRPGEITLSRPVTAGDGFEKWISKGGAVGDAGENAAIIVYDEDGNPVRRYKLSNVLPKGVQIESVVDGDTSVLIEKLVLSYEQLEVE